MSLELLKTKFSDLLATELQSIRDAQSTYFGSKGKYFQGIATNNAPSDLAEVVPDLTKKPTDQAESWADVGITLKATLPVKFQVDVYDGPQGKGWTIGAEVIIDGKTYVTRVQGAGNEDRAFDWREVVIESKADSK